MESTASEGSGVSQVSFDDIFRPAPAPPRDQFEFSNPAPMTLSRPTKEPAGVKATRATGTTAGFLRDLEYGQPSSVFYESDESDEETESGSEESDSRASASKKLDEHLAKAVVFMVKRDVLDESLKRAQRKGAKRETTSRSK